MNKSAAFGAVFLLCAAPVWAQQGLIVHYPLDETSGATARNTVDGSTATLHASAQWAGPGVSFNGTTDYVESAPEIGNGLTNQVTLAAWIYPRVVSFWNGIITKGNTMSPYTLQTWDGQKLRFTANLLTEAGNGSGGGSWDSAATLRINVWHHVAATYDGTTVRFYINGVLDTNQPAADITFAAVNEPVVIGADYPGGDEYFRGTIRDARIYNRALSAAEIKNVMAASGMVTVSIGASVDDVEESSAGAVNNSSTDLELTNDGAAGDQVIGLRFLSVPLPAAATITSAALQFTSDETQSEATSLNIFAEAGDAPAGFATTANDVSGRARTTASVAWQPPAWNTAGETGADQRTPDLKSVVQEVASRPGWAQGNPMSFIITGTGHRTAEARNKTDSQPAQLFIHYTTGPPPAGPYADWLTAHPGLAGSAALPGSDPDHDGYVNLVEYALASDPLQTPPQPVITPGGHTRVEDGLFIPALAFKRNTLATDVTIVVQTSSNLTDWTDIAKSTGGAAFVPLLPSTLVTDNEAVPLADVLVESMLAMPFQRLRISRP